MGINAKINAEVLPEVSPKVHLGVLSEYPSGIVLKTSAEILAGDSGSATICTQYFLISSIILIGNSIESFTGNYYIMFFFNSSNISFMNESSISSE